MRPNPTKALAVLATAGVLALGVAYTTTAPGPRPRSTAPISARNSAVVGELIANRVGGRATRPHAETFVAGRRGTVIHSMRIWDLPVHKGNYQISFKALVLPHEGDVDAPVGVICGVADVNTFGERTHVYTADSSLYQGGFPAVMSGAEVVRIQPGARPGLICTTAAGAEGVDFTLFSPVTASFTRIGTRDVRRAHPISLGAARVDRRSLPFWAGRFGS
jgi:hypothetical protein